MREGWWVGHSRQRGRAKGVQERIGELQEGSPDRRKCSHREQSTKEDETLDWNPSPQSLKCKNTRFGVFHGITIKCL